MRIKPVLVPTVVLELEGYFNYDRNAIFYRNTPIDLLDFGDCTDAVRVDLVHSDIYQYRLVIEGEKHGNWELMLDKTTYWWFCNGIWISETPIRIDGSTCIEPQVRLDIGFDTQKKYRLQWIQMP